LSAQTTLILDDVLELPLSGDQAKPLVNCSPAKNANAKATLFVALTDSFVPEAGHGVPRLQCRVVGHRIASKVLKLSTNNEKHEV
jgi:hypothetical protein